MKGILIVTDSEAVKGFERAIAERHRGFTVLEAVLGSGRSGVKAGDRVHPGASSLVFTVVPESELETTLGALRRARAESGFADETRVWAFDVEELH
ncbi:MAG TPA: hypothetical protein VLL75_00555 [Vicinamibacteria bacterium]|jgi:hypothetical protein|nr:hypothetical protein [Vicinamibacteria bacterium]